jgi:hypothetical protein
MSPKYRWSRRSWIAALIFATVAGLTVFLSGQQGGQVASPSNSLQVPILSHGPQSPEELQGITDDWTHHHLFFSDPGTEEEAAAKGRHEEWLRIVNDPRYIMQQLKRHAPARGPAAEYVDRINAMARTQDPAEGEELAEDQLQDSLRLLKEPGPGKTSKGIHRDWSTALNGLAATATGTISANDASGTTTVSVGGQTFTGSAPATATASGTFSGNPTNLQTVVIGGGNLYSHLRHGGERRHKCRNDCLR